MNVQIADRQERTPDDGCERRQTVPLEYENHKRQLEEDAQHPDNQYIRRCRVETAAKMVDVVKSDCGGKERRSATQPGVLQRVSATAHRLIRIDRCGLQFVPFFERCRAGPAMGRTLSIAVQPPRMRDATASVAFSRTRRPPLSARTEPSRTRPRSRTTTGPIADANVPRSTSGLMKTRISLTCPSVSNLTRSTPSTSRSRTRAFHQ